MSSEDYPELIHKGLNTIEQENYVEALMLVEHAQQKQDTPLARTYLLHVVGIFSISSGPFLTIAILRKAYTNTTEITH